MIYFNVPEPIRVKKCIYLCFCCLGLKLAQQIHWAYFVRIFTPPLFQAWIDVLSVILREFENHPPFGKFPFSPAFINQKPGLGHLREVTIIVVWSLHYHNITIKCFTKVNEYGREFQAGKCSNRRGCSKLNLIGTLSSLKFLNDFNEFCIEYCRLIFLGTSKNFKILSQVVLY